MTDDDYDLDRSQDELTQTGRRNILKGIGIAGTGLLGFTGTAFAGDGGAGEETKQPVDVKEVTKIKEIEDLNEEVTILEYAVKVVEHDSDGNVESTDYFQTRVTKPTDMEVSTDVGISPGDRGGSNVDDDLSVSKVDESAFNNLKEKESKQAPSPSAVQPMDNEGIIERQEMVSAETGSCAVYGDYTHQFQGATIEFTQRVNDIGITTLAAAFASYLASGGIAVAATLIGGAIALVSDTDSITGGVNEFDTIFGTVTNNRPVAAVGYNVTDEDNFVSPTDVAPPGHPFR